jgi:uncharacterized surface protein with fasciclin (FAS1) repeats
MNKVLCALGAVALLAGCSGEKGDAAASATASGDASPSEQKLAAALAGAPALSTFAKALTDTGVAGAFDGAASYTVLAPTDAAFGKLGDPGKTLLQPEQRAALAEVVRNHVLPGFFTPSDIKSALDKAGGKSVTMPTMGKGSLTFAKSGDGISVTSSDGAKAMISGDPVLAANGVAIPVDGVLKAAPTN